MQERPSYLFDYNIRSSWIKMSRLYNQKANTYGISMSLGYILLQIDKEGTPSTQLGPRMGMEPTSLSRTLATMEEKGLIRREPDKNDKRMVRIFLTDEGLKARYTARDVVFEFNNKVLGKVSQEQIDAFHQTIMAIQEVIDQELEISNEKL